MSNQKRNLAVESIVSLALIVFLSIGSASHAEEIVRTFNLGKDSQLDEVVFSNNLNKVYVSNLFDNNIAVIDANSGKIIKEINLPTLTTASTFTGTKPVPLSIDLAINNSTNKIYAASYDAKAIYVIDANNDTLNATVPLEGGPFEVAVNETLNKIYTGVHKSDPSGESEESIAVIDGKTNSILKSISSDNAINVIAVNQTTNKIYVSGFFTKKITLLDGNADAVTKTISLSASSDGDVQSIAIDSKLNKVFATYDARGSSTDRAIFVIDGNIDEEISKFKLSPTDTPSYLLVNESNSRLFVSEVFIDTITTIDSKTNNILDTTHVSSDVGKLAYNPNKNSLYVAGKAISEIKIRTGDLTNFSSEDGIALVNLTSDIVNSFVTIFSTVAPSGSLPANVRPFRTGILQAISSIEKALGSSKTSCGKKLPPSVNRLKSLLLSVKKVNNTFFSEESTFSDDLDILQTVVKDDSISDGIPDVCGN